MALTLVDSRTTVLEQPRIIQFGPPGCGKSVGACTFSKLFPQSLFEGIKPKTHVYLKDVLFVLADKGGLDSLAEHNLSAPILPYRQGEKVIAPDYSGVSGGAIVPAIEQIGKDVVEAVDKLGIEVVVFDTFSTIDAIISAYCQNKFQEEKEQMRVWGTVLSLHLRLIELMRPVRATVIYNCHSKGISEVVGQGEKAQTQKEKQELDRRAAGMSGSGNIITPEITGRAFRIYNGACSLVLPITAERKKEQGKWVTTRKYHPRGYQGNQAKNRFQSLLDEEEPVNGRALIAKIKSRIHLLDEQDAVAEAAALEEV